MLIILLVGPMAFRCALMFPAIAIGHSYININNFWYTLAFFGWVFRMFDGLRQARRRSKGQTIKIFASYMLPLILWLVAFSFMSFISRTFIGDPKTIMDFMFINSILVMTNVYFMMVFAGLNSTLYMQLQDVALDFSMLGESELAQQRANPGGDIKKKGFGRKRES